MHIPVRKPLIQALIVSGLIGSPVFGSIAWAQDASSVKPAASAAQTKQYNISAGSLSKVLSDFASQAGILMSADAQTVGNKKSAGLSGQYTVSQALDKLLANSGVNYSLQGNTVTLVPASAGVMTLNPVRVADSLLSDSLKGPGTSVGISKERLDVVKPRSLKDVFSAESSVSVGGNNPINQKLYVRGVEETALAVRIDGARQNNKIFHHNATNLIDPALLKSVSASAGVAPADDGPGAVGGSANFETVDVADVLDADDNFGGFVDAGYDTNAKTFTTGVASYAKQDGFEVLGYVNRAAGDDYKDGNGDRVAFSEADLLSGLAKVAFEAETGDRFEFSAERVNDDSIRPYRANFGRLTAGRPVPDSRRYDLERTNLVFNYSNQRDSGLWNPNVVIAQGETELVTTERPLAAPNTKTIYNGITRSQSIVAENLFITGFAEITAGVDYYRDRAQFKEAGAATLEEKAKNTGAFVQFRQQIGDIWELSYGARHDSQKVTGTDDSRHSDSGTSANIFVEANVSPSLTLKAGYADVWGGIALAENFILNGAWDYSAGLKPVRARNSVIGFEHNDGNFRFGANYYETHIADGREPSFGGGPGLVADFDTRGHEVFWVYYKGRDELSINYSNMTTKRDGAIASSFAGNYFTIPLGEQVALNATKGFDGLNLLVGATVEYAYENDNLSGVGAAQESYTTVDIFAEHEPVENLTLRLEVNNLTDEDYTDRASYGQEFATVETLLEPGRAFVLSARYEF